MDIQNLAKAKSFTTKDGSEIRELLSHRNSGIRNQSLAEARIAPGLTTPPHYHPKTEEIYYIVAGSGLMTIDGEQQLVGPADAISIPPGATHQIHNSGDDELVLLCCCCPGYEDSDTILLEPE